MVFQVQDAINAQKTILAIQKNLVAVVNIATAVGMWTSLNQEPVTPSRENALNAWVTQQVTIASNAGLDIMVTR